MSTIKAIRDYMFFLTPPRTDSFHLSPAPSAENKKSTEKDMVSSDIERNLEYVKKRFNYPKNNDIVIRQIELKHKKRAFAVFIDGMVETESVNEAVIKTLQSVPYLTFGRLYKNSDEISEKFISHAQSMTAVKMDDVFEEINFGSCAVFIEGVAKCFLLDVRGWEHRSIDKPDNEKSIYGPQEAFGEMLRTNTVLIRKIVKDENLIAEGVKIGKKSKTRGVMLYISDIANPDLVEEARRRLNGIDMDYVISIEEVALMCEENTFTATTHFLQTERPDRAARALTQGRIVFLLNGSPQALIIPTNIFELTHAVSDDYLRIPYANMARIVRGIALGFSILLPALYLAVTLFHQEIIPTYLLYSIAAARESVPFPSVIELFLMDLSFEMIREAGLRMPGPIGSTLGIVGGLILGQAAVSAKIVSPIMIIVIAITGIGSFATSDYSLSWSFRVMKIIFIFLASLLGFYGVAVGIFLYAMSIGAQKSFGVPFLAPPLKVRSKNTANAFLVNPIWRREKRPGFLYTQQKDAEPKVSRKWKQTKNVSRETME